MSTVTTRKASRKTRAIRHRAVRRSISTAAFVSQIADRLDGAGIAHDAAHVTALRAYGQALLAPNPPTSSDEAKALAPLVKRYGAKAVSAAIVMLLTSADISGPSLGDDLFDGEMSDADLDAMSDDDDN